MVHEMVGDGDLNQASAAAGTTVPITYHTGSIMAGTTNIYYIFYGAWATNAKTLMTDFAKGIGGSPYFNINTTYTDQGGARHVSNSVRWVSAIVDNYSRGKSLGDADIRTIVSNAITSRKLPSDPQGLYFVVTDKTVKETSGFCTVYCGWHTYMTLNGQNLKYSFIGDAAQCPNACQAQPTSPNGQPNVDAMVSVIAHELEEAVTDPNLNAWFDAYGRENADKCAWTFGTTYRTPNGAQANMKLGAHDYLIQRNWVNVPGAGYCDVRYP